jgi:hypothetical protein
MIRMDKIEQLLEGAIDLHIHSGPGLIDRSLNHVEACQEAMAAGMKAVVLKDQHGTTANLVPFLREYIIRDHPLMVYGGVPLNNAAGGVNPRVVEAAIGYGAKVIWMPTLSAKHHKEEHARQNAAARATMPKPRIVLASDPPITLLDGNGRLLPEVKEICQMIAQADIILGCGHLSKKETDLLIEEAKAQGVKKIVINHPELHLGVTLDDMRGYAKAGVFLEHVLAIIYSKKSTYEYILEMIRAAGAGQTVISTDLGQPGRPRPVQGLKEFLGAMLRLGLTENEIKTVLHDNPAKLLNLA